MQIYGDRELAESATIRKFRIVQTEDSRQVSREVRFRKWSGQIVKVGL